MDVLRESRKQFSVAFQRARDYKRQGAPASNRYANLGEPIGCGSQGIVNKGWMTDGATGKFYPMARKVRKCRLVSPPEPVCFACLIATCASVDAPRTVGKHRIDDRDAAGLCAALDMLLNAMYPSAALCQAWEALQLSRADATPPQRLVGMQTVFWDPEGRADGEEPCADEYAYLNACTALRDPARPDTWNLNNVVTLHELQFRPNWSAELHGWENLREAQAAGYNHVQMWRVCMYMEYCEEGATSASFGAHAVALRLFEAVATSSQRASAECEPGERVLAMTWLDCLGPHLRIGEARRTLRKGTTRETAKQDAQRNCATILSGDTGMYRARRPAAIA